MTSYIGKTQIKKWLIEDLKSFLKQYGFKITPSVNVDIIKENDKIVSDAFITVDSMDNIRFRTAFVTYRSIEQILFNITNLPVYDGGSKTLKIFPYEKYGSLAIIAKNRDDVRSISEIFKKVFLECFLPAFERYSDPKNVLELWDSLDEEGKTNHFFDPYKNCKILILSKISNDPKFPQRCIEEYNFYKKHYDSGLLSAKVLMDDCERVIRYLEKNEL